MRKETGTAATVTSAKLRPCSHWYNIGQLVTLRSVPKSGTERDRIHTGTEKTQKVRSRNWAVRKSEPEIGTIRYRTVPFRSRVNRSGMISYRFVLV